MGMIHRVQPDPSLVLYRDRPRAPLCGVGRLPAAMTLNSITEYPMLRYTAGGGMVNAGCTVWSPWSYGEELDVVAMATAPTPNNGSPGLGPLDDSILFHASDYFLGRNNTFADVTTEDMVLEMVIKHFGNTVISKYDLGGTNNGWVVYTVGTKLRFLIDDASGSSVIDSANLDQYQWLHALFFADRSGTGRVYINGVLSGSGDISPRQLTVTAPTPVSIGAYSAGGYSFNSNIAYVSGWKHAAWLDTQAEQDTLAEQRASQFWGWRPQQARGTAVPTVRTRASNGYLDKREGAIRKYYLVGSNVPRAVERVDKNGARIRGYLPEVQTTNVITFSTVTEGNWSKNDGGDTTSTGIGCPFGLTAEGWIADNTNGQHGRYGNSVLTAVTNVYWAIVKSGTQTWCALRVSTAPVTAQFFNLTTGELGVSTAIGALPTTAYTVDLGDGWWLCAMSWTPTVGVNTRLIYPAVNDGTINFAGDGVAVSMNFAHAQWEIGNYHTSPIVSAFGATIREEDVLRYKGDDGNLGGVGSNQRGQLKLRMLCEDYNATLAKRLITLSDGGSGADILYLRSAANDMLHAESIATGYGGGAWTGTSDVIDGAAHTVELPYEVDQLGPGLVDGVAQDVADTGHGIADDMDRIDVGVDESGLTQPNSVVADVELFPRMMRV